jgi:hypothetical protein
MNSSDFTALYKLMSSHLDRTCIIFLGKHALNAKHFVKFFELTDTYQPDRIACVHTTKVVENTIQSTVYQKFTDLRSISNSMMAAAKDILIGAQGGPRKSHVEHLKKIVEDSNKTPEEQECMRELVDQHLDLVINTRIDMTITFDAVSKKVTQLKFDKRLLSMDAAECIR